MPSRRRGGGGVGRSQPTFHARMHGHTVNATRDKGTHARTVKTTQFHTRTPTRTPAQKVTHLCFTCILLVALLHPFCALFGFFFLLSVGSFVLLG
uniref:Transmembrane protein n=1 Tax=Anopheles funestus TaxID=62324 RepID=A0A182S2C1_ANOFN